MFEWIFINPSSARIFTVLDFWLLEDKVLHKGAWVATLLGSLNKNMKILKKVKSLMFFGYLK